MRTLPFRVVACTALAACADVSRSTEPPGASNPVLRPELSVVAFGVQELTPEGLAWAGNDLGQAVGERVLPPSIVRPWLSANGVVEDLPVETGAMFGNARSVNAAGIAVGVDGLSGPNPRAVLWHIAVLAQLDAAPGDASNRVKLTGRSRVRVAILGSRWLQAGGGDQSLTLGDDDGQETPIAQKNKLLPAATLTDVNRDGWSDLVAEFEETALVRNGDLRSGTGTLVLLGRFRNGKHLRGTDVVHAYR